MYIPPIPAPIVAYFRAAAPVSTMRFASDIEGKFDLEAGISALPEVNLVEAF